MEDSGGARFNGIIRRIIKKSLFTERQIEIILHQRGIARSEFSITRGAYYRQARQSREKMVSLFYSVVLLQGLGVLGDAGVMSRLAEQVRVMHGSDMFGGSEEDVISLMDRLVREACRA